MAVHLVAVFLSILLLVYHQVTTWYPLFPWNDVEKYTRKELILEAGMNGIFMATGVFCLVMGNTGFCHTFPLLFYPLLFLGELVSWWVPVFVGKSASSQWLFDYDVHFSRTYQFFKNKPGDRMPDANHTVLHLLTLLTLIAVFIDRFQ